MPSPGTLPATLTFVLAAGLSVAAAGLAVSQVEERSVRDVADALAADGLDWAEVSADGLQIELTGTAPDEATRFRAVTSASRAVDAERIVDAMGVEVREPVAPPRFSVEVLRAESGITLIGLVPVETDREALLRDIQDASPGTEITDLLEVASYPVPPRWESALAFGIDALGRLPRAKVSISADKVAVTTMADSDRARERLIRDLKSDAPADVNLTLSITAPRPVITPFTLRFVKDADGARFDACAAASDAGRRKILDAAARAGMEGDEDCTIGLGAPSPTWPEAAAAAIDALAALPGGTVTLTDADVSLVAVEGVDAPVFQRATDGLQNTLPAGFSLTAVLPETGTVEAEAGPATLTAARAEDGTVTLTGRVGSPQDQDAVLNFARSLFGNDQVVDRTEVRDAVPTGWTPRVLATLDALSLVTHGTADIREGDVALTGRTGNRDARAGMTRLLAGGLSDAVPYKLDVVYDERLDPILSLPTPEECVAQINTELKNRKINFAPGSDTMEPGARETIDRVAELLRTCEDVKMEIAGFTDSQGREEMNRELSEARAQAVLTALAARRVLVSNLTAKGYGEERPIADNKTEAGREANRRIEFTLLGEDGTPVAENAADGAPEVPPRDAEAEQDLKIRVIVEDDPVNRPEDRP
ncbi:OmpA domain protein [Oceaniovalibus guishaninsula JLT2003]|uniref:OmpA domain protein n=1 Tax=Oceaniovalibus guishaninsula JLT2003 TaxID=1231392 RepID=K2HLF9_9RHOB|nr:OmpA family protein [Oceaniovalibus guishaninsula]EKE43714.1 OmpA domain protein [Oceaniovalibus guishaninsula JLT2003]